MSATMLWRGAAAVAFVHAGVAKLVKRTTNKVHTALVKACSKPQPPSRPGEYPHKDSGDFVDTIIQEFDPKGPEGRVGSNDPVAKMLELGTHKMAPRPWLTNIISDMQGKLKGASLTRGGKR